MYGESKATSTPEMPALVERSDGYEFDLTNACPASDIDVFVNPPHMGPRHFHTLEDTDGDGQADHQFTTVLLFIDRDGNGRLDRDVDAGLLRTVEAKAIQPGMAVECVSAHRRRVAGRVLSELAGVGRSVSLIQDRR